MAMGILPGSQLRTVVVCDMIPDDDLYRFGAGTMLRVVLQPVTSRVTAELYGERIHRMKTMFYDGHTRLTEGMGVCVDVAADSPCDYRILAADPWLRHHTECLIEWIDEGRRGERG